MQIEAVSRSRPKLDTRAYRGARGFRLGFSLSVICAFLGAASAPAADEKAAAPSSDAVTFTKDVAPILFDHCAICHRPEQSGPFSLLSYRDAKKHAKEIAEVTHAPLSTVKSRIQRALEALRQSMRGRWREEDLI